MNVSVQVSWWLVAGFWYLQCFSNGDAVALHWDINTDTVGAAVDAVALHWDINTDTVGAAVM